jgi:hypothetical protein
MVMGCKISALCLLLGIYYIYIIYIINFDIYLYKKKIDSCHLQCLEHLLDRLLTHMEESTWQ